MPQIETFYILNHSHTDIGFTDHQDLVFRQHAEFIDQAIDLCERTADYPQEAQYRWTCEVTGTTERYLETAGPAKLERFMKWHEMGRFDVGAMQYNFTPLLGVEQMYRSLLPDPSSSGTLGAERRYRHAVRRERHCLAICRLAPGYGRSSSSRCRSTRCRGGVPKPYPMAFWWEAPSGRKLLVWNGYHYLFGRSVLKLGDWRFAEREVADCVKKLEARDSYPFDFLFFQSTHPMRVDNGPPDLVIADFVRKWNELGNSPRLQLVAHREFAKILREQDVELPVMRGEWMDWWCDGVGSTAYETAVSRQSHQLLGMAETLSSWIRLKDWGQAPYSRSDANCDLRTSEPVRRAHLGRVRQRGRSARPMDQGTGKCQGWLCVPRLRVSSRHAGQERRARWPGSLGEGSAGRALQPRRPDSRRGIPPRRRAGRSRAQHAALGPPGDRRRTRTARWCGPGRDARHVLPRRRPLGRGQTGGRSPLTAKAKSRLGAIRTCRGRAATAGSCAGGPNWVENEAYRIEVDPVQGGLAHWVDKASGRDLAGSYKDWLLGQYVYERVTSPGRPEPHCSPRTSPPRTSVRGATTPSLPMTGRRR